MAVVSSSFIRFTVAESLNRDIGKVREWCNLWGMKLNESKTTTMSLSRSRTMYPEWLIFWSQHILRGIYKIGKIQRKARNKEDSWNQNLHKYLNWFTTASARGLFDYHLKDRTRKNGAKLIVKHFNTSVAQHFNFIKITTTWNAQPNEVVSSRTVNCFKKYSAENPPNVRVNW